MTTVYVLQVMAHHGYGLEGWRTVRTSSGAPYRFATHAEAQAALRRHFPNLRDGINVRVHAMDAAAAGPLRPVAPTDPSASSAQSPPHPRVDPSQ